MQNDLNNQGFPIDKFLDAIRAGRDATVRTNSKRARGLAAFAAALMLMATGSFSHSMWRFS